MKHLGDHSLELGGIEHAVKGLVAAQVLLGKELFRIAADAAGGVLGKVAQVAKEKPEAKRDCCHIPEPCWMPVSHGSVKCTLHQGSKGEITLSVVNEDFQPHSYAIAVKGADAGLVKISPVTLTLGPKEAGDVHASFAMPASSPKDRYAVVLWVVGCRANYVRWEIELCDPKDKCCEDCCDRHVAIHDQPDYVVHWYDHFYCARPCMGQHAHAVLDDGA